MICQYGYECIELTGWNGKKYLFDPEQVKNWNDYTGKYWAVYTGEDDGTYYRIVTPTNKRDFKAYEAWYEKYREERNKQNKRQLNNIWRNLRALRRS